MLRLFYRFIIKDALSPKQWDIGMVTRRRLAVLHLCRDYTFSAAVLASGITHLSEIVDA